MPNGFIVINEKDWEKATPEQRDWFIYSTLQAMNSRLKALEKKALFDKVCAFLGGVLGGVAAACGIKLSSGS
jgi:hypothetical protein